MATIRYEAKNVEIKIGGKTVGFMRDFTYESGPEVAPKPKRRRRKVEKLPAATEEAQADWFDKVWSAKRPKKPEGR